ncbi:hypothetical protein DXG03_009037 [Asterophora parasitica]|uniref:Enoyl reductase (ER) domain-containing protein n=1 Tax=Asterophora parasitica TaxID=117018 RepID=A0A9P7KB51_9AGAR|nr:hypothetical protein DXG03_009037 [Asterophora parasitica]
MARPVPLKNISSARSNPPEYQALTPRTPHSRSGRAEEGYTDFELQHVSEHDDDYAQHQAVPLLSSSAEETFPDSAGYRSRGDDHDHNHGPQSRPQRGWDKASGNKLQMSTILSRLPLALGSLLAGFLLFLIYMSYNRPEKLHKYFSIAPFSDTAPEPTHAEPVHQHNTTAKDPHLLISYANFTTFPLSSKEYLVECAKLNKGYMSHGKYWEPHGMGVMDVPHPGDAEEGHGGARVCTSTITYMLSGDVGLLADLALLAQAAALARERNRTFLIEDTYWNRGKWTDHFLDVRDTQPGPEPRCSAPPPEELVACPRLARHWVINSRTAKFHLGHAYSDTYEDPYAHNLNRLKPQFKSAEESLHNTIRPNKDTFRLIQKVRSELSSVTSPDGAAFDSYIAVHLRRGDRAPAFYRGQYVPAEKFVQAVTDSWSRLNPDRSPENLSIYVASDSPAAHAEVVDLILYTTFSLAQSVDPEIRGLASPEEYTQKSFWGLEPTARIRSTRGMIVDFALLSGAWARSRDPLPVATLVAVGMGWDDAFGQVDSMGAIDNEHKRWVEIDQNGAIDHLIMSSHTAIAATALGKIGAIQVPTEAPGEGDVLLKVEYASLVAFDTYVTDLGFYVANKFPAILGVSASGTVARLGQGINDLAVGDRVTAFAYTASRAKGLQEYSVQPRSVVSKIPDTLSLEEAATIPDNLITAFYALFTQSAYGLGLDIPASFPPTTPPKEASIPILVYGAGSTTGQYTIQLLHAAGYKKILATASSKHHDYLRSLGATDTFDYSSPNLTNEIAKSIGGDGKVQLAIDSIATDQTLDNLAKVISPTGKAAFLLPFKKANKLTAEQLDEFTMDFPEDNGPFAKPMKLIGVRSFLFLEEAFLRDNLTSKIIPALLESGIIKPNRVHLLNQGTFKDRVEQGLDLLRNNKVRGEKIVVKVRA